MVDKLKRADREYTQRNRINNAIDQINTNTSDISDITGTATTFNADITVEGKITGEELLIEDTGQQDTIIKSTSSQLTSVRLATDSADRRIIGTTEAGAFKTQIRFLDNSVVVNGATTGTLWATFDTNGMTANTIATTFCMGDVTTPTGTYITAVNTTAGLTLAQTQTEIDKIRAALINTGIVK